ncbi:hypothetical protein FRB94_007705 [Tulasnella sp. JGI-2019a]|nr:hypothetical protein FRB94_007705 [Tulasnella sp. JGI-2019a]
MTFASPIPGKGRKAKIEPEARKLNMEHAASLKIIEEYQPGTETHNTTSIPVSPSMWNLADKAPSTRALSEEKQTLRTEVRGDRLQAQRIRTMPKNRATYKESQTVHDINKIDDWYEVEERDIFDDFSPLPPHPSKPAQPTPANGTKLSRYRPAEDFLII